MNETSQHPWQIITTTEVAGNSNKKSIITKTNWIEEEDLLLDWAENANFEKYPLSKILLTFVYIDIGQSVVGVAKTYIELEKRERSSILHRSEFFDKVREANNPKLLLNNHLNGDGDGGGGEWSGKTYTFEDAAIHHIINDHESIDSINTNRTLTPIHFHKDVEKIPNSLMIFHDLSEIFVIMREVKKTGGLKTGSKDMSKTKKVRISDDSPKEFVFSKLNPVTGKRRTRKSH